MGPKTVETLQDAIRSQDGHASPWTFVVLTSSVPEEMRREVEDLFFFNPRQAHFEKAIEAVVMRGGQPQLCSENGRVWIGSPGGTTQCLFACDGRVPGQPPIGVMVYSRPALDRLEIVHIAVHPKYTSDVATTGPGLATVLVGRVLEIAHALRGVRHVDLGYRPGASLRVRG